MSDIFDQIDSDMGLVPAEPETPELGLYNRLTLGKYPKIFNCHYWLKQELYVYKTLNEKGWIISMPLPRVFGSEDSFRHARRQVAVKELARAFLEYYFLMTMHSEFNSERLAQMGRQVNLEKFLDMVIEEPIIKKLIDNPNQLI